MADSEQVFNRPSNKKRRTQLRKNSTEPERRLWQAVRGKQLGFKLRRQQGIGPYIVDFYCAEKKLVIELDGDSHCTQDAQRYDQQRSAYLNSLGLNVLRFTNFDVMQNLDGVLQRLVAYLNNPTPTLPLAGEGADGLGER